MCCSLQLTTCLHTPCHPRFPLLLRGITNSTSPSAWNIVPHRPVRPSPARPIMSAPAHRPPERNNFSHHHVPSLGHTLLLPLHCILPPRTSGRPPSSPPSVPLHYRLPPVFAAAPVPSLPFRSHRRPLPHTVTPCPCLTPSPASHRHLHLDGGVRRVVLQLKVLERERVDVGLGGVEPQHLRMGAGSQRATKVGKRTTLARGRLGPCFPHRVSTVKAACSLVANAPATLSTVSCAQPQES